MALTSAERKQRYRVKQKSQNYDEYKLKEKMKNKNYYANKIKHIDTTKENEQKDEKDSKEQWIYLEPLKKRINPINKSKLNNNTIELYLKTMKKLYKNYHDTELSDDSDLINVLTNKPYNLEKINTQLGFIKKRVYDIIKESNSQDIRIIYSVITRIKSYAMPVKQIYPYLNKNQTKYSETRENKTIDDITQKKINILSFDKDDIIAKYNVFKDQLSSNQKLIYVLLTLFPTRRAVDYRKMKVKLSEPQSEKKKVYEDKNNYYYNKHLYFNVTKNKKIQKYEILEELDNILRPIIESKKDGEYLLNKNGNQMTQNELTREIMETTYKIYGISISAVEIRKLYATHIKEMVKEKKITEKEHREISDRMNHKYEENKLYAY
jgi:hypothetical protein